VADNLARFEQMRNGELADGAAVLRAKIDMASPNISMRDPAIYRIRRATHHNTGDTWCIYPMYTFAHPIEDALENITHSFCTLEFEDQRPFYDWLLDHLADAGLLTKPPPKQYEFGRLNVTHVLTSKRKLKQLVDEGRVSGWDDPRMPTVAGLRARGYTPAALRAFADGTGASKTNAWVDYSVLEQCVRDDLDPTAARAMAVLDPLKLVITNWPASGETTDHTAPVHPQAPDRGQRAMRFGKEVWIERSDFQAVPEKGYHRLYPPHTDANGAAVVGSQVRLKYGYVVRCTGFQADANGVVTEVHAEYFADSKSGTPTSGQFKAKGVITWVSAADAGEPVAVNLYDHLFAPEQPGTSDADFLTELNPKSLSVAQAFVEPSLRAAPSGERFQFERHGYFIKRADGGFNRITGLKDSWAK
jgi:glutaminyl-tRNA synthetase